MRKDLPVSAGIVPAAAQAMGFLAILVTAILLISAFDADLVVIQAATNVLAAYCAWHAITRLDRGQ